MDDDHDLIILTEEQPEAPSALERAGQAANHHAALAVFSEFSVRKSDQTIRRYHADLALFAEYLTDAGVPIGGEQLTEYPEAWRGVTWGIVEGFKRWMVVKGYSIASINARLSAVKTFSRLAFQAGSIDGESYALIRMVEGYRRKEGKHLDEKRTKRRVGDKKEQWVSITGEQASALKVHPDTPQGRRDAVMMCLLLDHGLRAGELALLMVGSFDLKAGLMVFYRPKVDKEQTHQLTRQTLQALERYFSMGDVPLLRESALLRTSHKAGTLSGIGMTTRGITKRVMTLGEKIGVKGLSAHDCRHFWATFAARSGTDPFALQEAGGWASLAMPRRYVEEARIANEGIKGFEE